MHEKSYACPGVPDKNSKFCTFTDLNLEMLVLEGQNYLLNTVLLVDIGNWRVFA